MLNTEKLRESFHSFIDPFIPKKLLEGDIEVQRRSRLMLAMILISIPLSPIYAAILWFQFDRPFIALFVSAISFIGNVTMIYMLRLTKNLNTTAHYNLFFILITLVSFYFIDGGSQLFNNHIWIAITLPSIGVALGGTRVGGIWCLVAVTTLIIFHLLSDNSYFTEIKSAMASTKFMSLSSLLGICSVSFFLAALSESGKSAILRELDQKNEMLAKAHDQARLVLDNVDQGFVIVDLDGSLNPQHSSALENIMGTFDQNLKIWDYFNLVSQEAAGWIEFAWHQISQRMLPLDFIFSQIPKKITTDHDSRTLSLDFRRIDQNNKILLMITDITESIKAKEGQERHHEFAQVVLKLINYGSIYQESLLELNAIVRELKTEKADLNQQKIMLHKLKGAASSCGLIVLSSIIHKKEEKILQTKRLLDQSDINLLDRYIQEIFEKLKPVWESPEKSNLQITRAEYQRAMEAFQRGRPKDIIYKILESWQHDPTLLRFQQLADHAQLIAESLNKPKLKIEIEDNGIRLDHRTWREFWSAASQAIGNAVDHGIEAREERISAHKKASGKIKFVSLIKDGKLTISIEDDGKGIDWEEIKTKAISEGLPTDSHQELIQAMFASNLSTSKDINLYSGRGMGMSVLAQVVDSLGGVIEVASQPLKGTKLTFIFPLNIHSIDQGKFQLC